MGTNSTFRTARIMHGMDDAHAFELPFVFKNWVKRLGRIFHPLHPHEWQSMSDVMSCTWAAFVKCHKPKCPSNVVIPNCKGVFEKIPHWPAWSHNDRKYISLKWPKSTIETVKKHYEFPNDERPGDDRCDFWRHAHLDRWQGIRRQTKGRAGSLPTMLKALAEMGKFKVEDDETKLDIFRKAPIFPWNWKHGDPEPTDEVSGNQLMYDGTDESPSQPQTTEEADQQNVLLI